MIFGIGTDVLQADRVAKTFERFGDRFARRLLLDEEYRLFAHAKRPARFLAMRFAAKEAVVKALGTGFANGMWSRDVGMVPNRLGQPQVIFSARGRALCRKLGVGEGHLTLSDEAGLIVAVAVLLRAVGGKSKKRGAKRKTAAKRPAARTAVKPAKSAKRAAPAKRAAAQSKPKKARRRA